MKRAITNVRSFIGINDPYLAHVRFHGCQFR
jgi:hypothetical protein